MQQARRQPGSTFKPFVYGAAFELGASPADTLRRRARGDPAGGRRGLAPTDEDAAHRAQPMTLRDGLVVLEEHDHRAADAEGRARAVVRLAQAMGVRQSKLDPVPSLALGTSPVTLREMVAAYGTIANGGGYIEPMIVTRIEDRNGEVLAEFAPAPPEQALPPTPTR